MWIGVVGDVPAPVPIPNSILSLENSVRLLGTFFHASNRRRLLRVRTTLDISDGAYYIAKAIARDQNRSLGHLVGDLILQTAKGAKGSSIMLSDYGFPTFRCARPVTTEDVKALDDEE
jgi:hypothetical protein